MTEGVPELNEIIEAPEASREELTMAAEVVSAMVRASKGLKMYLPNNPLVAKFIEDLSGRLGKHIALYGDFKLDIEQFALKYRGKAVYENREPKESIAFKMYFDGIRYLIFSEGIEEHEVCDFLDIIGKDRPGDVDDDIVTLLWEKNLPHVTYILAEDFLEFDAVGGAFAAPTSQQEKIYGIYKTVSTTPVPPLSMVPQNILSLTEEEAEWLKKAREADEKRKPLDEVIQILTSVLVGEKDVALFGEFVEIMVKLTENLFKSEDIRYALNLVKFLDNLARNEQLPPDKQAMIKDSIGTIFSVDAARAMVGILDTTERITPEELAELLRILGKPSLPAICELLGLVGKTNMRKVVLQALIEIGHDAPEVFYPYLSDQRWYVVRNMAFILARIAHPAALESVVTVISHREPRVRREVLNYLERTPDQKAKSYILKFLRDDAGSLRIRALQILGSAGHTFALKPIIAMAASEQFHDKALEEKKAVYEALGQLGGDQMLPPFRDMIMKKYWFNKAKEREAVVCAVAGLMKMKSEGALRLLEEASTVKNEEIREIIARALADRSAASTKSGGRPRETF